MKKIIFAVILPLVLVSGVLFSFSDGSAETSNKSIPKSLSPDESKTEKKKWEATPAGVLYKNWEASPSGQKVLAGEAKIIKAIRNNSDMEAVVTSVSLPAGSRLGFGVMVRINDEDYILAFGIEKPGKNILNFKSEFDQLRSLKVDDKIIIKSNNVSHAPRYSYPIIAGKHVERDGKMLYKRTPGKGDC